MKKFSQYLNEHNPLEEQTPAEEGMNVTNIVHPSFVMCPPFNLHVFQQNNFFADMHVGGGG